MHKKDKEKSQFFETIVDVRRVTKVVKGGRIFSFSVLAVVGNRDGSCGVGTGKSIDITDAKKKAINNAKKNVVRVPLRDKRTINHTVYGTCGSTNIIIRPAQSGTGIVAGGSARVLLESIGLQDIVAKIGGSSNTHTTILATINALQKVNSLRSIANLRSKKVKDVIQYSKKIEESDEEIA